MQGAMWRSVGARVLPEGLGSIKSCPAALKHAQVRCMAGSTTPASASSLPWDKDMKVKMVSEITAAKEATGKTFTEISKEIGYTNAFTAQLFLNQARLHAGKEEALRKAVPGLSDQHIAFMKRCPMRTFDQDLLREPHIYRLHEAVSLYGEAIKSIMNEEFGDGIMSAIDMYATVTKIQGKGGEARVCVTLNGKFPPHVEQKVEDNTAPI